MILNVESRLDSRITSPLSVGPRTDAASIMSWLRQKHQMRICVYISTIFQTIAYPFKARKDTWDDTVRGNGNLSYALVQLFICVDGQLFGWKTWVFRCEVNNHFSKK